MASPAAIFSSLDCRSNGCCFSLNFSSAVEKMREGRLIGTPWPVYSLHSHARKRGWERLMIWKADEGPLKESPLWHVTWWAALAAIVPRHYSWDSFPIHSKLSLSYRVHFPAALGSYRSTSQHALQFSDLLNTTKSSGSSLASLQSPINGLKVKHSSPTLKPFSNDKVTAATAAKMDTAGGGTLKELPNPENIY